jgi:hypothetical protein
MGTISSEAIGTDMCVHSFTSVCLSLKKFLLFTKVSSVRLHCSKVKNSLCDGANHEGTTIQMITGLLSCPSFSHYDIGVIPLSHTGKTGHKQDLLCPERKETTLKKGLMQSNYDTDLCLCLTAHIQLLQPKCDMASKLTSKTPRYTMASRLEYFIVLPKCLLDGNCGLADLHTAK